MAEIKNIGRYWNEMTIIQKREVFTLSGLPKLEVHNEYYRLLWGELPKDYKKDIRAYLESLAIPPYSEHKPMQEVELFNTEEYKATKRELAERNQKDF